jgi:hypothetical protein
MRCFIRSIFSVLALLSVASLGRADLAWQFTDSTGATVAGNNFSVNQGSTIDIRVYLLETNGGTTLSSAGLSSVGVKLAGSNANAQVASASAITPNPQFDDTSKSVSGNNAILNDGLLANPVVHAPTTGADANRILVGTFTYSGLTAGTTNVQAVDPHAFADTVDGNGNTLDALIASSAATITVNAVPEPGTLVLTGMFAVALVGLGCRRRRREAAAAV